VDPCDWGGSSGSRTPQWLPKIREMDGILEEICYFRPMIEL